MARPAPHFTTAREFRVSFADRLAGVAVVDTHTPLPPLRKPPPPPDAIETPAPIENVARPAPPTDLWVTEIGAQLSADRRAIDTVLGSLTTAVGRLQDDHAGRLGEWRKLAVELAALMASKLLHERIAADEFNLEQMVRDMAADMPDDEVVSVRLNPHDLELLEKRLDGQPLLSGPADPRLIADHSLARGDCRVEGRAGVSVSDLTGQLNTIREDLLKRVA